MATPQPTSSLNNQAREPETLAYIEQGSAVPMDTLGNHPEQPGAPPAEFNFLAPPQSPDEIGRLGTYRILALLGVGGMGMVFRAKDPELDREVALKVILPQFAVNPQARQRFMREARAVAAVDHLHVVPIFHVGEDRGVPFLLMPLLKGQSLAKALKQNARPAIPELVRIGREIAEGLAGAHAQHLVHRDIKPSNIWLEGDSRWVRLLDFGLARFAESATFAEEPLTASGQVVGTPDYMSPEQAGGHPVTASSDLFSLGVLLYQMATGILPFAAPTMMGILNALATKNPEPPTTYAPDLPESLNLLIQQLLAKAPADRPSSALAVAKELKRIEAALTNHSGELPTVSFTAPLPRPRRYAWLGVAAGLVVILALGFFAQQQFPAGKEIVQIQEKPEPDKKNTPEPDTKSVTEGTAANLTFRLEKIVRERTSLKAFIQVTSSRIDLELTQPHPLLIDSERKNHFGKISEGQFPLSGVIRLRKLLADEPTTFHVDFAGIPMSVKTVLLLEFDAIADFSSLGILRFRNIPVVE